MSKKPKIRINQEGRDFALICALGNTIVNQIVLEAIYAKTFECSPEKAKEFLTEIRKENFPKMVAVLKLQGDLDTDAFVERMDTYPLV
jgi:hypothetical protein